MRWAQVRHSRAPRTVTAAREIGWGCNATRSIAVSPPATVTGAASVGRNPMRKTRTVKRPGCGSETLKTPRDEVMVRATSLPAESATYTIAADAGVTPSPKSTSPRSCCVRAGSELRARRSAARHAVVSRGGVRMAFL